MPWLHTITDRFLRYLTKSLMPSRYRIHNILGSIWQTSRSGRHPDPADIQIRQTSRSGRHPDLADIQIQQTSRSGRHLEIWIRIADHMLAWRSLCPLRALLLLSSILMWISVSYWVSSCKFWLQRKPHKHTLTSSAVSSKLYGPGAIAASVNKMAMMLTMINVMLYRWRTC